MILWKNAISMPNAKNGNRRKNGPYSNNAISMQHKKKWKKTKNRQKWRCPRPKYTLGGPGRPPQPEFASKITARRVNFSGNPQPKLIFGGFPFFLIFCSFFFPIFSFFWKKWHCPRPKYTLGGPGRPPQPEFASKIRARRVNFSGNSQPKLRFGVFSFFLFSFPFQFSFFWKNGAVFLCSWEYRDDDCGEKGKTEGKEESTSILIHPLTPDRPPLRPWLISSK